MPSDYVAIKTFVKCNPSFMQLLYWKFLVNVCINVKVDFVKSTDISDTLIV